jgi:preprotein translocase subunit SecG
MITVLLIIHLMIAAGLVGVVLLQRSEGGALGIGGGGGGFMTGRGAANFLTRVTAGLAAAFFVTSIVLTLLANHPEKPRSIFDTPAAPAAGKPPSAPKSDPAAPAAPGAAAAPGTPAPAAPGRGGVLDKLGPSTPRPPQSQ